ncbi:MAG: ECF-type sigma factor [Phycisphaerales bacterium]
MTRPGTGAPDREATQRIDALLREINDGRDGAFAELVDAVYQDLRRVAAHRLARAFDRPLAGLTMTPTVLVADAIMEVRRQRVEWQNTAHFFAIAARLMLRLIQHYRRDRRALRRGGGDRGRPLPPDAAAGAGGPVLDDDAIVEAMERLHREHPRAAEVVTLHAVCHHPLPDVALFMDVSLATAERDWRFARAWLATRLGRDR